MKKSLLLVFLALGLTAYVNAQWTVYDASVLPTGATPAWTTDDVAGDGAIVAINPVTNTLSYSSTPTMRNSFRSPAGVAFTTDIATWVVRARANAKIDTAEYGMQLELSGHLTANVDTGYRIDVKIGKSPRGGYLKISEPGTVTDAVTIIWPADSTLDVTRYHIYRVTMNGADFKVYVDEATTPVAEITSRSKSQGRYLRFGYFSSSDECEGFLNAMAWDGSGAYAPGAGTALPAEFVSDKGNIVITVNPTQDERDNGTITFLEELGYKVDTMNINRNAEFNLTLLLRGEEALNTLNAADLVIIGRSCQSDAYRNDRGAAIWNNKVVKPILNIHPYTARNPGNLLAWMSTNCTHNHAAARGEILYAVALDKTDPVFANSTFDGDTMEWSLAYDSYAVTDPLTNGELLVRYKDVPGSIFVRWEPGMKFFQGAPVHGWGAAPRTLFGYGNDENSIVNYWCLTENAQWVLKNEVDRLITTPFTVYAGSNDATLSALTVSEGTLVPAFAPATTEYTLTIADYVSPIVIQGTPNEPVGTVVGNITLNIPPAGITDSTRVVRCISSDASDTIDYKITITVAGLPLPDVILISDDALDSICVKFLVKNGLNVTRFWPAKSIELVGQDTIDMLNAADLLIIGRSGGSTSFGTAQKSVWNHLTPPLILNCPWKVRSNRLNWFNSSSANQTNVGTGSFYAHAKLPADPSFKYVTLVGDSLEWSFKPDDWILVSKLKPHNGQVVAQQNDSVPLVVRWNKGQEFYSDTIAHDTAGGARVYFGMGNDAFGGTGVYDNFFPLSKGAQAIYWAEVLRLAGLPVLEPAYLSENNYLQALALNTGSLVPGFHRDTLAYNVTLTANVDSLRVFATLAEANTVLRLTGDGWFKTPTASTNRNVHVIAENGVRRTYKITINQPVRVAVEDPIADNIVIYPNPVNDLLVIRAPETISRVTIYNLQGSEVLNRVVNENSVELSLGNLNPGVYFVKVQSGKNVIMNKITKN